MTADRAASTLDRASTKAPSHLAPNQAPLLPEHDAWEQDASLRYWVERHAAPSAELDRRLHEVGRQVGGHDLQHAADRSNVVTPQLRTHDRSGNRIDDVEFDASWHRVLGAMLDSGVTGMPWSIERGGYLVRAAALEQWGRLDIGAMCPVSMTTAAVPVLQAHGGPTARWVPGLTGASGARQLTAGMAMTEPQGGSDLASASTLAIEQGDGSMRVSGHKWFVSHPVADVLLVLAREPGLADGSRGLSCVAVPGWGEGGGRNRIELQQLKEKLGTRSLASAEVMFRDAEGERVGAPGDGVRTIIDMVAHTRMDCALGSTGIMSRAVLEAVNHARGRAAFGRPLVDQPLMRTVLADLALEREAALALSLEVARTFDSGEPLRRLVTAIAKYWVTRRAVAVAVEACEALGGNGYTEQFVLARLYRDAQVNSTWEGSGNVIVLDVFRALARDTGLATAFEQRVRELVAHGDGELAMRVTAALPSGPGGEQDGRRYVGALAMVLQAALLVDRAADTGDEADLVVARAFVATRLDGASTAGRVFGDGGDDLAPAAEVLLQRAFVED